MRSTWIKICANTNVEDARLACDLGADAVGFVFAASARQVTRAAAAAIVSELPDNVEKIGVFSSHNCEEIVEIVRGASLTGAQLHGGLDLALIHRLHDEFQGSVTIIQTLHWRLGQSAGNAEEIGAQLRLLTHEPTVHRVLIDSKTETLSGGTGVTFDWKQAGNHLLPGGKPVSERLIVAGGLRPGNVAAAVGDLQPWGVDAASGVEATPGRKDAEKMRLFIEAVRGAGRTYAE